MEVESEYDWLEISESDYIWSRGSSSNEWFASTFTKNYLDEIVKTVYVSANGHIEYVLGERRPPEEDEQTIAWTDWDYVEISDFRHVDQPWKYLEAEIEEGQTPPDGVTDRAIYHARNMNPVPKRLIVHYMQPHALYTNQFRYKEEEPSEVHLDPFGYLFRTGNREAVWNAMLDELRCVLDEVAILRENIDAEKVIISADHGDLFGEWGLYSHPAAVPHPNLRKVPWVEITAFDTGKYQPSIEVPESNERDIEEHLKAMGYR